MGNSQFFRDAQAHYPADIVASNVEFDFHLAHRPSRRIIFFLFVPSTTRVFESFCGKTQKREHEAQINLFIVNLRLVPDNKANKIEEKKKTVEKTRSHIACTCLL